MSTVEKTNHSPWQNAEVCQSHCRHNIQKFLLSTWQFFCWCIAEANWKIMNLPWHFITNILSTWILKAALFFKMNCLVELPYLCMILNKSKSFLGNRKTDKNSVNEYNTQKLPLFYLSLPFYWKNINLALLKN